MKSDNKKMSEHLHIRMSKSERAALEEKAISDFIETSSAVRELIRKYIRGEV